MSHSELASPVEARAAAVAPAPAPAAAAAATPQTCNHGLTVLLLSMNDLEGEWTEGKKEGSGMNDRFLEQKQHKAM